MTDSDNQEYITSPNSINGVGHLILAFLILQGKYILYKWALLNNLYNNTSLNTSNFGNSNNSLAIDWLKYLEKHSVKWQI